MIKPQNFTAKLADKVELNSKYVQLNFELILPNHMEFVAGQYISLSIANSLERRSYSIYSSPDNTHGFEVLLDITPQGIGSRYLNGLQFGQEVQFLSPLGFFTVPDGIQNPLVFVATGSGVAPMRSMILDQLQNKKNTQKIVLHWGLRHEEELFWEDEIEDLIADFPNFQFHPVISQAKGPWPLCRGRVTDCLLGHELLPNAHYFLCGGTAMVDDVQTILKEKNIPKENIHREKFY